MKAKARVALPIGRIGVALSLLGLALLIPTVAQAAQTHVLTESKGPDWGYSHPVSTAVDNGTGPHAGWTYNVDPGSKFVVGNEPDGTPALGFEPPGGYVSTVLSVAVDPNTGDVWVGEEGEPGEFGGTGTLIYKFDELGNYLTEIEATGDVEWQEMIPAALTVDPANGNLYVVGGNSSYVFDSSAAFVGRFRPGGSPGNNGEVAALSSVAAGAAGHIYISDAYNGRNTVTERGIDEFDGTGKFIRQIGDNPTAHGVAYDASRNQIIVNGGTYIAIYDAASGDEVDRFGSGNLTEGTGIAIDEATGVIQALDGSGWWYTFSPADLPNIATGGVTDITDSSATLNGTVDPAGAGDATCQFEYGETAEYLGASSPVACSPAGPYSTSTAVSTGLSGLAPATLYHYRIDASNSAGTLRGPDQTFVSGAGAPVVVGETVGDRGSDNARVDAQIQVMGSSANVRVEYGTSTSYGSTIPAAGRIVSATGPTDRAPKLVLQQLGGLIPDTTYHYRFAATNSADTTVGPDQTFHTFPVPENSLPDGRGYELVSPLNKNGHSPRGGRATAQASAVISAYGLASDDGQAVFYSTDLSIGNTATGMQEFSVSRRVNGSWTPDSPYLRPDIVNAFHKPAAYLPSADLSEVAFSGTGFTNDGDTPGLFISNRTGTVRVAASDGELTMVPAGAAPNLNPTYFGYKDGLLAQDPGAPGFFEFKDGELRSAGVLPDGSLDPGGAAPAATPLNTIANHNVSRSPGEFFNQVSADGKRAFFISPAPSAAGVRPVELYVHREGQSSLLASRSALSGQASTTGVLPMPSVRPLSCCTTESAYASASRDGSHVVFESKDQLTDDAPAGSEVKSYLFDVDTEALAYLPGVAGTVLGISDDGSRVFFAAEGELAVWEAGAGVTDIAPGVLSLSVAAVTPDGSALVFMPETALNGFNNGGLGEVYRYDTGADRLDCVSCPPVGDTPVSSSALNPASNLEVEGITGPDGEPRAPHFYADNGHRIFFETGQPLVAADTNSTGDVYEWEDGKVNLISAGRGSRPSFIVDSSTSGDDVFFGTADGLDPRDQDDGFDIYDAKVGAGPAGVTEPGGCRGSCQRESGAPPAPPAIASTGFAGKSAPSRRPKARAKKHHKKRHHKKGHHKQRHAGSNSSARQG